MLYARCQQRRNAIIQHASPVLRSGQCKIGQAGQNETVTHGEARDARGAGRGALISPGGAGRGALVRAQQRKCQPWIWPSFQRIRPSV